MKKEIELKFETDLPGEEYKLENNVIHLPLQSTPENLNSLLNQLLSLEEPKKFSFLIQNIKLTSSLEDFVSSNLLTTEQAITIYYILDINQPEKTNTIKEDEWIRNIQLLQKMKYYGKKYTEYCVGLFNGEISIYNGESNKKLFSIKDYSSVDEDTLVMLNDIKYFVIDNESNNNNKENEDNIQDYKILIKTLKNSNNVYDIYSIDTDTQNSSLIYSEAKKENEYFNSIAINPINFKIFALGGTENNSGVVKLYKFPDNLNLNITPKDPSKPNKKRKIDVSSSKLSPEHVFENLHNNSCLSNIFLDGEYLVTGGDDFTINVYNITKKNLFMTYNTNYKNVSTMTRVDNKSFLVGYIDGTVKYYELKENKASLIMKDTSSNYGYISDICMCNDKDNHPMTFATSSYDRNLKIWDIRGGKVPLYKIGTEDTEKNYAVKFNGFDRILSGGDGSAINIFKY